jgi:large subunit ribosomal protein L9
VKVIFIEDVPNVARAGERKVVADGYGRNYLLPRKLAVLADSRASNVVEAQLKKIAQRQAQAEAEMAEVAGKLNGMEFTIRAKAGEKERLYGSITSADIADEISKSAGLDIDKRKIELAEPIRELGSYDINISFTHDITAVIKLTVVAEEVAEAKEEKTEKRKRKPRAEKKAEEAEVKAEEAEVKAEEAEVKAEETEVKAEEAEVKAEETEVKAEETEVKVEEIEAKDAEPGE